MKRLILLVAATLFISGVAFADVNYDSLTPCKFSRAGTACEADADCGAVKVTVTVAPHDLVVDGSYLGSGPDCQSDKVDIEGTLTLSEARTYIVYLPLEGLPPGFDYSTYWLLDSVAAVCGNYQSGNPDLPVNCDAEGAEELPAINLLDLPKR